MRHCKRNAPTKELEDESRSPVRAALDLDEAVVRTGARDFRKEIRRGSSKGLQARQTQHFYVHSQRLGFLGAPPPHAVATRPIRQTGRRLDILNQTEMPRAATKNW